MALKAGRVGVAKDQVDEFGNIIGGGTPENVYTKNQCDNKFETKTHASNTFQPKTLEVPISMLSGSVLTTVTNNEQALNVLNENKENSADIGGLKFRDNSGTAQYKLPNGDWVNFSNGGSEDVIPTIDCSSLSPDITTRMNVVVGYNNANALPQYIDTFADFQQTTPLAPRLSIPDGCLLFKSIPLNKSVYLKLYRQDGTTPVSTVSRTGYTANGKGTVYLTSNYVKVETNSPSVGDSFIALADVS